MRPRDRHLGETIKNGILDYERTYGDIPGIQSIDARVSLIEQILESIHRVEYVRRLSSRSISELRRDPTSELYDPLKAAVLFAAEDRFDEACWQVFLAVNFGKNLNSGWRLARDIYCRNGNSDRWGWAEVSTDAGAFLIWLASNLDRLRGSDGIKRGFSNHRKYMTLKPFANAGTGAAVTSYVGWVQRFGDHQTLFNSAQAEAEHDARLAFAVLYEWMSEVKSFGRIGKFDYLTMIGKLGFSNIEPNSAYIAESTGPLQGARLLFDKISKKDLDADVLNLGESIGVNMQVMEDAICNWQKSTHKFVPFRG